MIKAEAVKKEMDQVLDNLKVIVNHVVQREELKIRQHTNPQLNHAKQKIVKEEHKVWELNNNETREHLDLRGLQGEVKAYKSMISQLRGKIA